ncbi:sigma 54-interacting transcriptional regulator [Lawsonibacter hominis]|uniref:sigma-54-dependent Fis family transcriptional regulator n=1 Tax=Lawsonibacter hominis TaxID=2763053 RepID=UPI003332E60C
MTDQSEVQRARACLRSGLPIPAGSVREIILESWLRCRAKRVPMEDGDKRVLPAPEVEQRIARRRNLCQVAFPYLDALYDFIKGSEFLALLSDEEGYVLYEQGDPGISAIARQNGLVKGACRSEARLGTNGIGTVLATQSPLQVFGAEHYYAIHTNWACSGAPIYLPDGSVGGVVCLSGMADKVNDHTLGMVVAAADAISRQLKLKDAYDALALAWKNLDIIIETVPAAICLLDENLNVLAFNAQATKQLDVLPKDLENACFLDLVGRDAVSAQEIKNGLANRSVTFERGRKKHTISLSVQATGKREYVALIEQLSTLHKRVNNIMGNDAHFSFQDIVGSSPPMQEAVRMAQIAARNDATVFLAGESGTGKELFAQAIHNASPRRDGPFIAVNCGALPKSLIEAELFGYESGSFTGAKREGCAGKFELANGGTIFLDEIGDMPFDVQVTLLRVLQNREVRRIGASKTIKIDVRIITATNQDLERLVADKVFREDLFYRINVFHIRIPPLRERVGDVRLLSQFFLFKYGSTLPDGCVSGFTQEALDLMERYPWPGNVRQLENSVERAVYLTADGPITPAGLPPELRDDQGLSPAPGVRDAPANRSAHQAVESSLSVRKNERQRIEQALQQTHGNVKEAAVLLEISRRTLYRRLHQYGIDCGILRT